MPVPLTLAAACALTGLMAALRLRRRSSCLRAWQRALTAMYASCAYARSDCGHILRAGAYEVPALRPIARAVETEGADAERLFEAGVSERLLRAGERAVLLSVMRALANGNREEIAAAIAYALERFRVFCADSDGKRDTDARLYMMLGLLSGVCVFLILC